jgi:hypothetical protein
MSFNIHALTPTVSLNRVCIAPEHPDYPDCVRGKTMGQCLSTQAIHTQLRQQSTDLGLENVADDQLLSAYFDLLQRVQSDSCHPATLLALGIGRRFGYMLRALHEGDTHNRAQRPEWDASYWSHWTQVRHVYLAGGLARIPFGALLRQGACQVLRAQNIPIELGITPYPVYQPLIGASRLLPADGQTQALVLDFGQTNVKRAIAHYDIDNTLTGLSLLPSVPSLMPKDADDLQTMMLNIIRESAEFLPTPPQHIALSIAAYISDEGIHPQQGGRFGLMREWSDLPASVLAQSLSTTWGEMPIVRMVHDASAAALHAHGRSATATVTMGTALGIGFSDSFQRVLPVSQRLTLHHHDTSSVY